MDLIGKPVKDEKESHFKLGEVQPTVADTNHWLLKIGGNTTNVHMEMMGTPVEDIKKFQLFRLIKTVIGVLIGVAFGLLSHEVFFYVIGVVLGAVLWFFDYLKVEKHFQHFQFTRQLDFNKFIRMLMPYLRVEGMTLYKALNKMKDRLDDGTTRNALIALITKLNSRPNDRAPYEEFAKEASGQDQSELIMQTLFDFHQSSNDSTTIKELAKIVDHELEKNIDEISDIKDGRFEMDNYLLGMCLMVVVFGYFLAVVMKQMSLFNI